MVKYITVYEGNEAEYTPNRNKVVRPVGVVCHIYLPKCFEGRVIKKIVFQE